MQHKDYYKILQVDPEADEEVITAAYHRLAKKYHSDVSGSSDPQEQRRMYELNEAYEILSKQELRASYDAARRAGSHDRAASSGTEPPHAASGRPQLRVWPEEVIIEDVDPRQRAVTFYLQLEHVGGPPFDCAVHELYILPSPPWDGAPVTVVSLDAGHPLTGVEFEMDISGLMLEDGKTYSGAIEIEVQVKP